MGRRGPKPGTKAPASVPDPPPGQAGPPGDERKKARERVETLLGDTPTVPGVGVPGKSPTPGKAPSKQAKAIAQVITPQLMEYWKPWAESFALYFQIILEALFPQEKMKVSEKEFKASVFAWLLFLVTCPPENLRALAIVNIGLVHVSMLGSRIVKWALAPKDKEIQDGKRPGPGPGQGQGQGQETGSSTGVERPEGTSSGQSQAST